MKKSIILLLLGLGLSLQAQTDTSQKDLNIQIPARFKYLQRPYLEMSTIQGGASKQWSTNQMLEFFYGDFVDDAEKAEMMSAASSEGLSLGSIQSWDFRLAFEREKTEPRKGPYLDMPQNAIFIYNRSYNSLKMSPDMLRLFLYGNRATAGEAQDISDFNYQSWFYSGIGYQYSFLIDTLPVSVGLSLVSMHTLDDHSTGQASLTTAPDGSHIDFAGAYHFGQSGATTAYSINGWGLALNLETHERFGNHEFSLAAYDLGAVNMPNWLQIDRDSSFSFEGINLGNLFNLSEGSFNNLIDSLSDGLLGGGRAGRWKMLPFRLQFNYRYHFQKQFAYADLEYLHLPNWFPRAAVGYGYRWKKFKANTGLAYGGFNGLSWDLGLDWKITKHWQMQGGLSNLFGLALPGWSGGTIGNYRLRYTF